MIIEIDQKEIIIQKITASPSRESLLSFISWLDKECLAAPDQTALPYQLLGRCVVALGYKILEQGRIETVVNTIKSGENYVLDPTEETWDVFSICSTLSYPFGPGDGCFSIKELEDGSCKPGSGCSSGAGSLASQGIDETEVMLLIKNEIEPWITGKEDPVLSRAQPV